MAKKQIKQVPEYRKHVCGECGWGEFSYEFRNLDVNGNPICLKCPYEERRKRLRSEPACDKWKPKPPQNAKSVK